MEWLNSLLVMLTSVQPAYVPFTVFCFVMVALFFFFVFYLIPAFNIVRQLKSKAKVIASWTEESPANKLKNLGELLVYKTMKHSWSEFKESLHSQKKKSTENINFRKSALPHLPRPTLPISNKSTFLLIPNSLNIFRVF